LANKEINTICNRSVLDTTIPNIRFDENGVSQYCKIYDSLEKEYPLNSIGKEKLTRLVNHIKEKGKGKKYDCIIGVSGGTDSTYTLYKVIKEGLRPLAVHFDNGWNSKLAVKNIKNSCKKMGVDLYTYVVNWEEFKDLQISFLKASTPDAEIPTDVGIHATLIKIAAKEKIKYVLNGHSFRTELIMPKDWTYMDGRYIKSVHKKFGERKLKTFPNFTILDLLYYNIFKRIKVVPFLNFYDYEKAKAKIILENELNWEYSGGHHHESVYTHFFQSYYLPKKFKIDKRKIEYSAMILSEHLTREEAFNKLNSQEYPYKQEIVDYTINKLGLSKEEFKKIVELPIKSFRDYRTYYPLMRIFKTPIKIACNLGFFPKLLYQKFLSD
jgi:N-acetyl sugar amidotransferase